MTFYLYAVSFQHSAGFYQLTSLHICGLIEFSQSFSEHLRQADLSVLTLRVVTARWSLPGGHCQVVTARWSLPGGHCQVVTARWSLPGGHCQVVTARWSLLFSVVFLCPNGTDINMILQFKVIHSPMLRAMFYTKHTMPVVTGY